MSIIFGIDPGSIRLGYGVIEKKGEEFILRASGTIEPETKKDFPKRLNEIYKKLREVLKAYPPDCVVGEKIFLGKSAESAFKLGHARGICLQLAAEQGAQVVELATRSVKKSITGRGSAEKEQVKLVLERMLGCRLESLDESDALALAVSQARAMDIAAVHAQAFS